MATKSVSQVHGSAGQKSVLSVEKQAELVCHQMALREYVEMLREVNFVTYMNARCALSAVLGFLPDTSDEAILLARRNIVAMPADSRHKAVLTARLHRTARKLGKNFNEWVNAAA
jgi:hypothetical protein